MTRYKRAYSKCTFCGIWLVFANPVTYTIYTILTYCSLVLRLPGRDYMYMYIEHGSRNWNFIIASTVRTSVSRDQSRMSLGRARRARDPGIRNEFGPRPQLTVLAVSSPDYLEESRSYQTQANVCVEPHR